MIQFSARAWNFAQICVDAVIEEDIVPKTSNDICDTNAVFNHNFSVMCASSVLLIIQIEKNTW